MKYIRGENTASTIPYIRKVPGRDNQETRDGKSFNVPSNNNVVIALEIL